jgi:membrane protease YdiL (CAAX protease family)
MLTEKPWRPYSVVRLVLELFVSVCIGSLLVAGLNYAFPNVSKDYQKLYSILIWVGSFHGVALLLIARFLSEHDLSWTSAFGFPSQNWMTALGLGVVAIALTLRFTQWLGNVSHVGLQWLADQTHSPMIEPQLQEVVKHLQGPLPWAHTVLFGFATIALAPVAEELLFRGILYPTIKQNGHPRLAWMVTSVVFALTHFNLMVFLPLTFLAIILTLLYEFTGNLIAPITTHSLFNAVNFCLVLQQTRTDG